MKTQQRLLIAASRVFAEKGYQATTIAEVCEQAGSNIASVNYHFRDKENLYLEAWRYAFQQDLQRHPADGGVLQESSAEARLAGRIRSLIARIADPECCFFDIVYREMTQQTRLLEQIMAKEINVERQMLNDLIRELLGAGATESLIKFCHASLIGQCFHLLKIKHLKLDEESQSCFMQLRDAEAYAEHVVKFSLAGMNAVREVHEKN